ncbi:hypothetical protein A6J66_016185 [Yersinia enterocolitica]|nr:hypothetical protein A6J66_016185 [Yersinia enterocolitica]
MLFFIKIQGSFFGNLHIASSDQLTAGFNAIPLKWNNGQAASKRQIGRESIWTAFMLARRMSWLKSVIRVTNLPGADLNAAFSGAKDEGNSQSHCRCSQAASK